jgi:hypothetical protein
MFIARCVDAALFAAGVTAVIIWGWPSTFWGWSWLSSALLPLASWIVWRSIKRRLDDRAARRTMEYRRAKFGGFVNVPQRQRVERLQGERTDAPAFWRRHWQRPARAPHPWASNDRR